jgi:hypothetical protein
VQKGTLMPAMNRYFNIAGPCNPQEHYMLPSEMRRRELPDLIEQKQYFVIHAARQSGKTTLLFDLVNKLNATGNYFALYCSLEALQDVPDAATGIPAIMRMIKNQIMIKELPDGAAFRDYLDYEDYLDGLRVALTMYCKKLSKPLIILFDEIDCLSNGTLIAFLRQLRNGYVNRATTPFVHSIGLIGMRNIRDYKGKIRDDRDTLGSASPFNIVTEALTLRNFTGEEIAQLLAQHTRDVGQAFSLEFLDRVFHYTQGQPWLVNAVARQVVVKILNKDFSRAPLPAHVDQAVETIIQRRHTHIDSLLERLKEERVQKIVEPLLMGETRGVDPLDDDYQYVLDLGLLKESDGLLSFSNPIYSEVVVRYLGMKAQNEFPSNREAPVAYTTDDRLDMKRLLADFQAFWREHSEIWLERFQYKEAAPHLVLMAFLQKIAGQDRFITREMASGRGRLDICIQHGGARYPIEIKIRKSNKTAEEGKAQLSAYMENLGCGEGWLVVFDRRKKPSWKSKLFWKTETVDEKIVHTVGC